MLALLLLFPFLITSCWDQVVIEKTGYMLLYGMELTPQDQVLATFALPVISEKATGKMEVVSVTAVNSRQAREKARTKASLSIAGGKTQSMLFSTQLADKGLQSLLEIFERDPANPSLAYVVVVDGSPKELIEKISNSTQHPDSAMYVRQLLDQNMNTSKIPQTRIYNFDINCFADGIDPIAPLIKLDGNDVSVEGAALFSDDRMVGRIDTDRNILLEAMMGKLKPTEYTFTDKALIKNQEQFDIGYEKQGLTMLLNQMKPQIELKIVQGIPNIHITLDFSGNLSEYMWANVSDKDEETKIESILSSEMERECNELVKYLQTVGSDPIGIGNMLRYQYSSYWDSIDWSKVYQDAVIDVDANVKFVLNGTIK